MAAGDADNDLAQPLVAGDDRGDGEHSISLGTDSPASGSDSSDVQLHKFPLNSEPGEFPYFTRPAPCENPLEPPPAGAPQRSLWQKLSGPLFLGLSLLVNVVVPIVLYKVLEKSTDLSDAKLVLYSSLPSLAFGLLELAWQRRWDVFAVMNLMSLLWALLVIAAFGNNAKLMMLNQSFPTLVMGACYLVSLALRPLVPSRDIRPLSYYFARHFIAVGDNAVNKSLYWNWLYESYPTFRYQTRVGTWVWGVGLVGEFTLKCVLLGFLSLDTMNTISPLLIYGTLFVLIYWQIRYSIHNRNESRKRQALLQAESVSIPVRDHSTGINDDTTVNMEHSYQQGKR